MRKVIRNYNDFVKSKSINEDLETLITPDNSEIEQQEGHEGTLEMEEDDQSNLIDSEEDVKPERPEEVEEEESGQYIGNKLMSELAERLDATVEGNVINYKGNVINFYSEDEKFHIGKNKFETIDEVVDFFESSNDDVSESKRFKKKKKK